MKSNLMAAVSILALAPHALAHEGHGDPAWYGTVLHYFAEPVHLVVTLVALVALAVAWKWVSSTRLQRLPLRSACEPHNR